MLGARSRLVRGVLAQLSQLFGATVLCHGVLKRKSLVRDLFRLVSYRPLAGKPLIRSIFCTVAGLATSQRTCL